MVRPRIVRPTAQTTMTVTGFASSAHAGDGRRPFAVHGVGGGDQLAGAGAAAGAPASPEPEILIRGTSPPVAGGAPASRSWPAGGGAGLAGARRSRGPGRFGLGRALGPRRAGAADLERLTGTDLRRIRDVIGRGQVGDPHPEFPGDRAQRVIRPHGVGDLRRSLGRSGSGLRARGRRRRGGGAAAPGPAGALGARRGRRLRRNDQLLAELERRAGPEIVGRRQLGDFQVVLLRDRPKAVPAGDRVGRRRQHVGHRLGLEGRRRRRIGPGRAVKRVADRRRFRDRRGGRDGRHIAGGGGGRHRHGGRRVRLGRRLGGRRGRFAGRTAGWNAHEQEAHEEVEADHNADNLQKFHGGNVGLDRCDFKTIYCSGRGMDLWDAG